MTLNLERAQDWWQFTFKFYIHNGPDDLRHGALRRMRSKPTRGIRGNSKTGARSYAQAAGKYNARLLSCTTRA